MAWATKYWLGFASLATLAGCGAAPGDGPDEIGESAQSLARAGVVTDLSSATATTATTVKPIKTVGTIVTVPLVPASSDLTLDDSVMHFDGQSQQGLDIHVINVGEAATTPPPSGPGNGAAVTVNGIRFIGHIYPYYPATSPTDSLVPFTHGYIHVAIPAATLKLSHCAPYAVHIDVDHTMQVANPSRPDVFSNDTGYAWTECLTWLTPVTSAVMGQAMVTALSGQTLHWVVSNDVSGRDDGKLCSNCHYRNAPGTAYRPEVDQDHGGLNILPDTVVGGGTWQGGTESWSYKFLNAPFPHTDELRGAVTRWRQDLQRQRFGQLLILLGSGTVASAQIAP